MVLLNILEFIFTEYRKVSSFQMTDISIHDIQAISDDNIIVWGRRKSTSTSRNDKISTLFNLAQHGNMKSEIVLLSLDKNGNIKSEMKLEKEPCCNGLAKVEVGGVTCVALVYR